MDHFIGDRMRVSSESLESVKPVLTRGSGIRIGIVEAFIPHGSYREWHGSILQLPGRGMPQVSCIQDGS